MSALSTPGGGGTTAQNKPTSGKQKYQKLDINSLYCANRNESSEPSSVKSQLSRKHGMQSLGKVPSARRPPANLPSLKTETGQDSNTSSLSAVATTTSSTPTCITQTTTAMSSSAVAAGGAAGGWVALPPPTSPHFRTEFPSLEAAAQPSHRTAEHSTPQLRPQTEGSWTSGGSVGGRQDNVPPSATAPATGNAQQTPAFRAILPSFLMKGSNGGGLGLGTLAPPPRENRPSGPTPPRQQMRAPPTPRAVEVLTARPILRPDQINSLDDISRDAGWAQHDDIDYDQKLDFSDGESSTISSGNRANKSSNRNALDNERIDPKVQDPGDEEKLWAERRQKQSNEVAQAVARARQRKEEEQRRQMRETPPTNMGAGAKDSRDRDRDYSDRDKDWNDNRDKDRSANKDRDLGDKDRNSRDSREKERLENRERNDNRDRYENRERQDIRERDRDRGENRDRVDNRDRERIENRDNRSRVNDRERNENVDKDRDRADRERFDRDRNDRDRVDRERADRDKDRDRDFRDRDYGRDRDQSTPAFLKTFQTNIPPRFLKQQQNRQDEQHKGWAFSGKSQQRRTEPQAYNAPRHAPHNGRRSYSREYSEDEFRKDKESGQQWRSEMQDYDRSGREVDRQNSKESYKEYVDKRGEFERKSVEPTEHSRTSAAEKLSEVFERKSVGLSEPFVTENTTQSQNTERRQTPPANQNLRDSADRDYGPTSWAEASQEATEKDHGTFMITKLTQDANPITKSDFMDTKKEFSRPEDDKHSSHTQSTATTTQANNRQGTPPSNNASASNNIGSQNQIQNKLHGNQSNTQNYHHNQSFPFSSVQQSSNQSHSNNFSETQSLSKTSVNLTITKTQTESNMISSGPTYKQGHQLQPELVVQQNIIKPMFIAQKSEKELSESDSVASKSSTDPSNAIIAKSNEINTESLQMVDSQKRMSVLPEDKRSDRFSNDQLKSQNKEPIERKSSGSGSEKKGRGHGSYAIYTRGWGGPRESRGRRSHRSSRSNNRASESDASTDGTPNVERKERRRAPRSPRGGNKKTERPDELLRHVPVQQIAKPTEEMENREPFAPRGQPSRRGRGGFQGTSRPPAPAKRVTAYGPPNTKSPFGQANRAVKGNEDNKDSNLQDDKVKNNKSRTGSSAGRSEGVRGRERKPKGPLSGEDENWETTSEHSENGMQGRRRSVGGRQGSAQNKPQSGRNQGNRFNNNGRHQSGKKDNAGDNRAADIAESLSELKLNKKDDEIADDGFQEVRNKKNSKDSRGLPPKEDTQSAKQPRSHSNQGNGRNGSSSRNPNDKPTRGSAPVSAKPVVQYDRPRQPNLAPRFVKQRQKQQMGLVPNFGPDTGAAPPPPPVNAWDKPIAQSLRASAEDNPDVVENKSGHSSQRSSPGDSQNEAKVTIPSLATDKTGVLDGATPPVETIIFENTNYKSTPPTEALKQKYQSSVSNVKSQGDDISTDVDTRSLAFNGEVRLPPRSIQELISENGRQVSDGDGALELQMSFEATQKNEDSSDMKLDFAFDSDLGQLTEDKAAKTLGLPRSTHSMSSSSTISPLAADLNLKIASVKKVWEMPAVVEGTEELQFAGFEEPNNESGAPPNVCKVKPTQQLQSPPPQHYNHVGYQSGYGGLSVPSPPVMYNSSQQLLGSSQQLQQQGSLYGTFLDQSRGQFGAFPGTPYGAGSAAPYNYQPPPDMFQSLPSQYRMAAAAGSGAAFGQTGQLGNSPSTVLISSTSNSLMSASVKPSTQQIGAIGSKGGGVGGVGTVGGVGGVNTYQAQQFLGYSGPVGESPYSLPGLLPRPAPPTNSYYSPYQPPSAPAPTYPLQFTQQAQTGAFGSQFQLQVAAAVQQMQQQYRAPIQQQYAPPTQRPPPQQMKSPLHEHANGFAPLHESASPTPKGGNCVTSKPQKPPHSPPQHKYHAAAPHQHPHSHPAQHTQHTQHSQHTQHQQQQVDGWRG